MSIKEILFGFAVDLEEEKNVDPLPNRKVLPRPSIPMSIIVDQRNKLGVPHNSSIFRESHDALLESGADGSAVRPCCPEITVAAARVSACICWVGSHLPIRDVRNVHIPSFGFIVRGIRTQARHAGRDSSGQAGRYRRRLRGNAG